MRFPLRMATSCALIALSVPIATGSATAQTAVPPQNTAAIDAAQGVAEPAVQGDVVVTGSRIRRDPTDQPQPVVILDESAVQRTGLSAIADVLQRLPSSSGGSNTKFNNSGNLGNPPDGGGVGAGSASIDLAST